ncbi:MAG: hypothetical protein ACE5GN_05845, partial [Waddliaceae bacterium]
KFDVRKTRLVFALALIVNITMIVVSVALGIGLGVVAPYVFLGFAILSLALLLVGYLYLLKKKPNMANSVNRLRSMAIAFLKIPHAIRSFQLQRQEEKMAEKTASTMEFVSAKMMEMENLLKSEEIAKGSTIELAEKEFGDVKSKEEVEARIQKLTEDIKVKLTEMEVSTKKKRERIEELERDVKKWEDRFNPLKVKIAQAGWKDFAKTTKLDQEVLSETVAEALMYSKDFPDPELEDILKRDLRIDRAKIDKLVEEECKAENAEKGGKVSEDEVRKKVFRELTGQIKSFFGGTAADLLQLAKRPERQIDILTRILTHEPEDFGDLGADDIGL